MELQQQVGQAREQAQAHQQSAQVEQERLAKEKQQLHQAVPPACSIRQETQEGAARGRAGKVLKNRRP